MLVVRGKYYLHIFIKTIFSVVIHLMIKPQFLIWISALFKNGVTAETFFSFTSYTLDFV